MFMIMLYKEILTFKFVDETFVWMLLWNEQYFHLVLFLIMLYTEVAPTQF